MATDAIRKVEATDFDAFDWNWHGRYYEDVVSELAEAFTRAMIAEFPDASPGVVQIRAGEYAEAHAADMLKLDAPGNVVELTRARMREIVSEGVSTGQSVQTVAKTIRDDFAFSKARSSMIARTETAKALGQGAKGAAIEQGRDEKHWVTQGDGEVSDACVSNSRAGWLSIGDVFPSGADTVPEHPNCRCNVRYRTRPEGDPVRSPNVHSMSEVRCPQCKKLVGRDLVGVVELVCDRCGERFKSSSTTP